MGRGDLVLPLLPDRHQGDGAFGEGGGPLLPRVQNGLVHLLCGEGLPGSADGVVERKIVLCLLLRKLDQRRGADGLPVAAEPLVLRIAGPVPPVDGRGGGDGVLSQLKRRDPAEDVAIVPLVFLVPGAGHGPVLPVVHHWGRDCGERILQLVGGAVLHGLVEIVHPDKELIHIPGGDARVQQDGPNLLLDLAPHQVGIGQLPVMIGPFCPGGAAGAARRDQKHANEREKSAHVTADGSAPAGGLPFQRPGWR